MASSIRPAMMQRTAGALLLGIIALSALQGRRLAAGSVAEQLELIAEQPRLFQLENLVAALLTLPSVALLSWLAERKRARGCGTLADGFIPLSLGAYLAFIHLAYASQYVLFVPWLTSEIFSAELASIGFIDTPTSVPGLLKLLGYTFCSAASLIIALPTRAPQVLSAWVRWPLLVSGVTGLAGLFECALLGRTSGWGLLLSGLFVVPYALGLIVTERRADHDIAGSAQHA